MVKHIKRPPKLKQSGLAHKETEKKIKKWKRKGPVERKQWHLIN